MSQDPANQSDDAQGQTPSWGPPPSSWVSPERSGVEHPYSPNESPQPEIGGYDPAFQPPLKPGVVPFRPLSLADLLDGTFAVIRKSPGATLVIAAVAYLALSVFGILAMTLLGLDELIYSLLSFTESPADTQQLESLLQGALSLPWYSYLGVGVASFVLSLMCSAIVISTSTIAAMRGTLNLHTEISQAFRLGFSSWGNLIVLNLVIGVAGIVPFVLLLLAGIWLAATLGVFFILPLLLLGAGVFAALLWVAVRLVLAPTFVVSQSLSIGAALAKSWRLTKSTWWRTFGIVVIVAIIISILGGIISSILGAVIALTPSFWTVLIAGEIIGALTTAVGASLYQVLLTLLHVDLRIRRERLDVGLLHELAAPGNVQIPGHDAIDYTRAH